jgi:hypothetical protein
MPRRPSPNPRCANCTPVTVPAESHLDWAAGVGARVARHHNLRGQERDDLVSAAQLTLLELLARSPADGGFDASRVPPGGDPGGAFRGWAYRFLACECGREAARIRGGGTFHTARPENLLTVGVLGDSAGDVSDDDGDEDTVIEREGAEPDVLCSAEPHVVYGRTFAGGRV